MLESRAEQLRRVNPKPNLNQDHQDLNPKPKNKNKNQNRLRRDARCLTSATEAVGYFHSGEKEAAAAGVPSPGRGRDLLSSMDSAALVILLAQASADGLWVKGYSATNIPRTEVSLPVSFRKACRPRARASVRRRRTRKTSKRFECALGARFRLVEWDATTLGPGTPNFETYLGVCLFWASIAFEGMHNTLGAGAAFISSCGG